MNGTKQIGYVYAFSNKSYPGIFKVGCTHHDPKQRALELYTTGVIHPFHVEYGYETTSYHQIERRAHRILSSLGYRVHSQREFFECNLNEIINVIHFSANECQSLCVEEIERYNACENVNRMCRKEKRAKRKNKKMYSRDVYQFLQSHLKSPDDSDEMKKWILKHYKFILHFLHEKGVQGVDVFLPSVKEKLAIVKTIFETLGIHGLDSSTRIHQNVLLDHKDVWSRMYEDAKPLFAYRGKCEFDVLLNIVKFLNCILSMWNGCTIASDRIREKGIRVNIYKIYISETRAEIARLFQRG